MKKQKTLIILGGLLIFSLAGSMFYLAQSNQSLQASIAEGQNEAQEQIEMLQTEVQRLKNEETSNDNSLTIADLMNGGAKEEVSDQVPTNVSTMSEEELLSGFFKETPTLIERDTTEDQNKNKQLVITPETFDLGEISKQNGLVTASFELKNEGVRDLDISYALSSCGCTTTPLPEDLILKPGESYTLEASYDPNFYGPDYELGPIEKTITLISNDSSEPFKKIRLIANVKP